MNGAQGSLILTPYETLGNVGTTAAEQQTAGLNEIGHIHWHFVYMGIIKLLNVFERTLILFRNKINCYTLPTESATATNPTKKKQNNNIKKNEVQLDQLPCSYTR